jgi:diguanylate cyclase (GGDEF)-like protein
LIESCEAPVEVAARARSAGDEVRQLSTERGAERERAVAWAGLELAAVDDEDGVREVALSAARAILADVPGAEVTPAAPVDELGGAVDDRWRMLPPGRRSDAAAGFVVTAADPLPPEAQHALDALRALVASRLESLALVRQMQQQALHDALTGLPNRVRLELDLRGRLLVSPESIHVLLLDLDGFEPVNDEHGHARGDELLRVVAARLVDCVGDLGLVARLGGDEFIVVVRGDEHEADDLAARLADIVQRPAVLSGVSVTVGASVGIAHGHRGVTVEELLRQADAGMHAARQGPRDRLRRPPTSPAGGSAQSTSGSP